MGNKLTPKSELEKLIFQSKNKSETIKKEINGIIIGIEDELEKSFYKILLNEGYIKCIISCNKLTEIPIFIYINECIIEIYNGKNYLKILKFKLGKKIQIESKNYQEINFLNPLRIYNINTLNERNSELLISTELKYILENTKKQFIDIYKNKVYIEVDDFLKENQKFFGLNQIYLFKNVLYQNNRIKIISISLIEEINEDFVINKKDYTEIKNMNNNTINHIINFKSKIKKFSLNDNSVFTVDGFKINFNSNLDLMNKISINGITYFNNFNINGNEINSTILSYINSFEDTIIELYFIDFNIKSNYFNQIIIENFTYKIKDNFFNYKIKKKIQLNYYAEKIFIKGESKILEFNLYVYKGQINHFTCFINIIGGYHFEFIYESLKKENLPIKQTININNKTYDISLSDNFDNTLKNRFCIINIPKQEIKKEEIIFENVVVNNNKIDYEDFYSWQIFYIITDKKYIFSESKIEIIANKKEIKFNPEFENELYLFYKKYKIHYHLSIFQKEILRDYPIIFNDQFLIKEIKIRNEKEIDEKKKIEETEKNKGKTKYEKMKALIQDFINNKSFEKIHIKSEKNNNNNCLNYQNYIIQGFTHYNIKNTKKQYRQIKSLCCLLLCKYLHYHALDSAINKIRQILYRLKSLSLSYIDKIQILLGYTNYILKYPYRTLNLVLLGENYDKVENLFYKSHNFLINLYDKLNEESALFRIFNEYNNYIKYNFSIGHHSFTGSLLNINNIKLDLYKISKPYYFLFYLKKSDKWGYYESNSKNTFINMDHFNEFKEDIELLNNEDTERVSFLISLVFIHERGGHGKLDNINVKDFPRYYYSNNFKIIMIKNSESGYVIDKIIYNNDLLESLYEIINFPLTVKDVNLFVGTNFDKLNELMSSINNNIIFEDDNMMITTQKPKYIKRSKDNKNKRKRDSYYLCKYNMISQDMKKDDSYDLINDREYEIFLNIKVKDGFIKY